MHPAKEAGVPAVWQFVESSIKSPGTDKSHTKDGIDGGLENSTFQAVCNWQVAISGKIGSCMFPELLGFCRNS